LRLLTGFARATLGGKFTSRWTWLFSPLNSTSSVSKSAHTARMISSIRAAGQADFNDRGAHVRPGLVPAARNEAGTHPDAARSTRSVEGISVL
jgi:hypothetical protein